MSMLPPLPPGFEVVAPGGVLPDQPPPLPPGFEIAQAKKPFTLMDTWPVRMAQSVYSAVTLPGDVYQGKATVPQSENMPGGEDTTNIGRVLDLASIASPVNPAVRAGDRAVAGAGPTMARVDADGMKIHGSVKPDLTSVPTASQLDDAGRAGYRAANSMGVDIAPAAVQRMGHEIARRLEERGLTADNSPQTYAILNKWQNPPEGAVAATIGNLDSARQALSRIHPNANYPGDTAAAAEAIRGLEVFTSRFPRGSVLAGPAEEAQKVLREARGNYAAARRVNKITGELDNAVTGIAEKAELGAQVANSGMNRDNRSRQLLASLLQNKKNLRGFNTEEISAIKDAAGGTGPQNAARYVGNLLGGGGGFGQAFVGTLGGVAGAAATGSPLGAAAGLAPAAVGFGSKAIANKLAQKHLDELARVLAMRSPLAKEMSSVVVVSPEKRAALVRALLLSQPAQQ